MVKVEGISHFFPLSPCCFGKDALVLMDSPIIWRALNLFQIEFHVMLSKQSLLWQLCFIVLYNYGTGPVTHRVSSATLKSIKISYYLQQRRVLDLNVCIYILHRNVCLLCSLESIGNALLITLFGKYELKGLICLCDYKMWKSIQYCIHTAFSLVMLIANKFKCC